MKDIPAECPMDDICRVIANLAEKEERLPAGIRASFTRRIANARTNNLIAQKRCERVNPTCFASQEVIARLIERKP